MKLPTERADRIDERLGSGDGVAAGGRLIEAVAEEEHPIRLDEVHRGVIRVVSTDVPCLDPNAAELEANALAKHDVGARDFYPARRRELSLDVLGVLRGGLAGGDAALERLVAPVDFGELLEVAGGELVRHDVGT